jgi:hypothetical protein
MTIRVTGLPQLQRDLIKLGLDIDDLKNGMAKLSDMGAKAAIAYVPKLSGALAGSIRGNRAKSKAVITAGRGKTSQYVGLINYGAAKRGISASMFMQRADATISPRILPTLNADIDRLIAEKGLR